ncbi:1969_t:CDS:1, partial [Dentiscutata erythropus]
PSENFTKFSIVRKHTNSHSCDESPNHSKKNHIGALLEENKEFQTECLIFRCSVFGGAVLA